MLCDRFTTVTFFWLVTKIDCICLDNEINTPFDPNEFATLIGWYRQRAKNFDRPNGKRLELEVCPCQNHCSHSVSTKTVYFEQKQKLAQENEISFLEDVQSTFESLEHMSDFASLSIYSHDVDLDKPSMVSLFYCMVNCRLCLSVHPSNCVGCFSILSSYCIDGNSICDSLVSSVQSIILCSCSQSAMLTRCK